MGADVSRSSVPRATTPAAGARRSGRAPRRATSPSTPTSARSRSTSRTRTPVGALVELDRRGRRARPEHAPGLARGARARRRGADERSTRGSSTARCGRSGARGPLKLKPGYEPHGAGVLRPDDDERRRGRAADAHRHLHSRLRHRDVGGDGRARRARASRATGRGCVVDASLFETGLAWLKGHYASFRASGEVPERHRTGSNRVVPFQAFETKTGPVIVAAGNDRLFVKLAKVLGHPEWVTDPRFATNARAGRAQGRRCSIDRRRSSSRAARASGSTCSRPRACRARSSTRLPEAVAHPQAVALGMIQRVPGRRLLARRAAAVVRRRAPHDPLGAAGASASTTNPSPPESAGAPADAGRAARALRLLPSVFSRGQRTRRERPSSRCRPGPSAAASRRRTRRPSWRPDRRASGSRAGGCRSPPA